MACIVDEFMNYNIRFIEIFVICQELVLTDEFFVVVDEYSVKFHVVEILGISPLNIFDVLTMLYLLGNG